MGYEKASLQPRDLDLLPDSLSAYDHYQFAIVATHSFLVPGDFLGVMSQVLDISIPKQPCQIRFVPVPREIINADKTDTWEIELNSVLDQFTDPLPLTWGSHSFGLIDVAERRQIKTSLLDMMGYRPVSPASVILLYPTCQLTRLSRYTNHFCYRP